MSNKAEATMRINNMCERPGASPPALAGKIPDGLRWQPSPTGSSGRSGRTRHPVSLRECSAVLSYQDAPPEKSMHLNHCLTSWARQELYSRTRAQSLQGGEGLGRES